jgi:hypothetical protein
MTRGGSPRDRKDIRRPVLRHDVRTEGSGYHRKQVGTWRRVTLGPVNLAKSDHV